MLFDSVILLFTRCNIITDRGSLIIALANGVLFMIVLALKPREHLKFRKFWKLMRKQTKSLDIPDSGGSLYELVVDVQPFIQAASKTRYLTSPHSTIFLHAFSTYLS